MAPQPARLQSRAATTRRDRARRVLGRIDDDVALVGRPKPPYRVPSMAEVAAVPENGLTVASTFSGCGGSCLGYRMAGYAIAWASEFIPAAQAAYRANHPDAHLDTRDIREVRAGDVLAATGKGVGELDLLDGSPPCASFSAAGRRDRLWGKSKDYSGVEQRTDDLFLEYVRLVDGLRPRAFVAENVPGLAAGAASSFLGGILGRLRGLGYRVDAAILDAARFGVPQHRRRLFIVGVREDVGPLPGWPTPFPYAYSIADAWAAPMPGGHKEWCRGYAIGSEWGRLRPGEASEKYFMLRRLSPLQVCPTVTQIMGGGGGRCKYPATIMHPFECRYPTIPELRRLCGFPDDFALPGTFSQQWERLGRAVAPPLMAALSGVLRDRALCARPIAGSARP